MLAEKENVIKQINEQYKDNPVKERLAIAAAIQSKLRDNANQATVVGGSAVEFYSAASYMTRDLDFILKDDHNVKEVMKGLGFKNDGDGIWYHDDSTVIVEFPKGPLNGDISKLTSVETPFGIAEIIGIEDIIIDRASAVKYWQDSSEWTQYLMTSHYDNIDWEYLRTKARELNCEDTIDNVMDKVKSSLQHDKNIRSKKSKFSDKEAIDAIIALLNNDKEPHQIVGILSMNGKIFGNSPKERGKYVQNLINSNPEIVKRIKQLDNDNSR